LAAVYTELPDWTQFSGEVYMHVSQWKERKKKKKEKNRGC